MKKQEKPKSFWEIKWGYKFIKNRRGQIFEEFLTGLFTLLAITFILIVLDQIWNQNLYGIALRNGVDSTNLSLIDKFYDLYSIPLVIAIAIGIMIAGRIRRVNFANV